MGGVLLEGVVGHEVRGRPLAPGHLVGAAGQAAVLPAPAAEGLVEPADRPDLRGPGRHVARPEHDPGRGQRADVVAVLGVEAVPDVGPAAVRGSSLMAWSGSSKLTLARISSASSSVPPKPWT
jgi:hypothetical protein